MKRLLLLCFVSLPFIVLQAQDVAGFWKGSLTFAGGCFAQNNIELQLKMVGDAVYGDSYHYMDVNNFIRKDANGYFEPKTKILVVQEGAVTAQQLVDRCQICIKKFQLTYRLQGNTEYLDGFWTGKIQGSNLDCGSGGTITLSRIATPTFKEEIIPTIKIDTGEVKLSFYDNGTIDGDSITVMVNKRPIIVHQKLTDTAVSTTVQITLQAPMVEVEMVAENEGSIPPNTALLEISAGNFFQRLYMSSTKEKSAKVRFVYEKDPAKRQGTLGKITVPYRPLYPPPLSSIE